MTNGEPRYRLDDDAVKHVVAFAERRGLTIRAAASQLIRTAASYHKAQGKQRAKRARARKA